jgi:hypothetical protein
VKDLASGAQHAIPLSELAAHLTARIVQVTPPA